MPRKTRPADTRKTENQCIEKIATRAHLLAAKQGAPLNVTDVAGDIMQCHRNGCALKLAELLNADEANFMHDVRGIMKHLDTNTGELRDSFWPRYAQPGE